MSLCCALGSTCFFIGPFPGYANLVGDSADAVTFFVGSILFTVGGALQSWSGLATFRKGHHWLLRIGFFLPIVRIVDALIAPAEHPAAHAAGIA